MLVFSEVLNQKNQTKDEPVNKLTKVQTFQGEEKVLLTGARKKLFVDWDYEEHLIKHSVKKETEKEG